MLVTEAFLGTDVIYSQTSLSRYCQSGPKWWREARVAA